MEKEDDGTVQLDLPLTINGRLGWPGNQELICAKYLRQAGKFISIYKYISTNIYI